MPIIYEVISPNPLTIGSSALNFTVSSGVDTSYSIITVSDTDSGYTWAETGSVTASNTADTVTLVSGERIDIDVDAASDAIRISASALSVTVSDLDSGYNWAGDGSVDPDPVSNTLTIVSGELINVDVDSAADAIRITSTADQTFLKNLVEDVTPELGGNLACADSEVQRPVFRDYGITSTSPASSSGTLTLDWTLGNAFEVTLTENVTTVTLSNPPASGTFGEVIIKFVQDSTGSWTVTWPASVKWPGGTAPVITTTLTTGTDTVALKTWDGGTTYFGDFSQDYS